MDLDHLIKIEKEIMSDLKDFQRSTVNRIYDLFSENRQQKVLVADEVGLGKTLVAKGLIARLARLYKERGADSFQVVYICSNMSIARQNMEKLRIDKEVRVDSESVTRLSMQALHVFEQRQKLIKENGYIQLTAMTPGTSFRLTAGTGMFTERALIFAVLKQTGLFDQYILELDDLLSMGVKSWAAWARDWLQERVEVLAEPFKEQVVGRVARYFVDNEDPNLLALILEKCEAISQGESARSNVYWIISKLRLMMARVSLEFLQPDLVIMDEFQRFRDLITAETDSEIGMLTQKFLHKSGVKTLLLSATPYKIYSTLEEIEEQGGHDEHYKEFREVIEFLFRDIPVKKTEFKETWSKYSSQLRLIEFDNLAILVASKEQAESLLYEALCRTERLRVSDSGDDLLDTEGAKEAISVLEEDIKAYIEADNVVEAMRNKGSQVPAPVEYVKSSPYLFSFMDDYQVKRELRKTVKMFPELRKTLTQNQRCWVRRKDISSYKSIRFPNARLRALTNEAFTNNGEWLLWVPPSLPYYEPGGPFRNSEGFSKILVFSAWVMVPRMIAALISYEAERRTIGLPSYKPESENEGRKNYFATDKRRFPYPKLTFRANRADGEKETRPERMTLFALLYPSIALMKLFQPMEGLNQRADRKKPLTYKEIERAIKDKLTDELDLLKNKYPPESGYLSAGWYWAAPLLIDVNRGYKDHVCQWLDKTIEQRMGVRKGKQGENLEVLHLNYLRNVICGEEKLKLGPMPGDLSEVLTWQVLGSPAICSLRTLILSKKVDLHDTEKWVPVMYEAYLIARAYIQMFNRPEAIAIVDQKYGKRFEEFHWRNVLRYCVDGNLQAVMDEFRHMLIDSYGLKNREFSYQFEKVSSLIRESMAASTASYKIDTLQSFLELESDSKKIGLRSHYAAGFYEMKSQGDNVVQRTDRLRSAFNSPFRPFVLATTSIGQEGLDFHYYCRKVMHWNLPANPIDLEQREGRINRYKNIAIRQNVARQYGSIDMQHDPWEDMFAMCKEEKQNEHCELIPYWFVPIEETEIDRYTIERIVPKYPFSRDEQQYERLVRMLSIYRISLGQARQEELLEYVLQNIDEDKIDDLKELFMNLSPYYRETGKLNLVKSRNLNKGNSIMANLKQIFQSSK